MTDVFESQALKQEAEALLTLPESQLEELLEMRVAAINQDTSLTLQPTFEVTGINEEAFPAWVTKAVSAMKKTALTQTYKLLCGNEVEFKDARDKLIAAMGLGGTALVLTLASTLTATLGMAAALATILATIVIKIIGKPVFESGGDALCDEFLKAISD